MVPYNIHSILLLLIIRHPNLVSRPIQKSLEGFVRVLHIISLVIGQLASLELGAKDEVHELVRATYRAITAISPTIFILKHEHAL